MIRNKSWKPFYSTINFNEINKTIKGENIAPKKENIYKIFELLSPHDIKVVIIGQDPYFNLDHGNPQANGIAFSINDGIPKPPSLKNIFNNMIKFGHLKKMPLNGNLIYWALQGVFLMNAALTTRIGQAGAHQNIWDDFSKRLLQYLNKYPDIIFVVWGGFACDLVNDHIGREHSIIVSSHPSPLSCDKKFRHYESFNDTDHFGFINKKLKEQGKKQIIYDLLD